MSGAPHLWAVAEWRESQRTLRWAWALNGAIDLCLGAAAAAIAVANGLTQWIGGGLWTLAFAVLSAFWLLCAATELRRARR